ncbi:6-phosphogluconolactonase [Phenylobacterium sp. J367]|uniref:6-phosphogluconolactonase n=1 Tax=Phenylobacterium sp. J367 TaxID=2898435 RepID=UPI002151CD0A|nr:6-phosphogluconolactonase [Phenylobacterium sp. J367]MCR5877933.1 6-phosphogluconolactonase [Phenylobacterium sp. J367]
MLETYPNTHALAEAAAHGVEVCLAQGLKTRGRASLVGTGGRSPGEVYDRLRDARIDWARVIVTLSDERCVAPDAPEANVRLLRERLMQGPVARAHVLPLWPEPEAAALKALLPFDAVLLGMGEDGHIASLIPGDPDLALGLDPAGAALTRPVPAGLGKPPVARITLSLSALLQSRAVFLLVAGEAKREVIARAQAGADLPVRSILAQDQVPVRVLWAPSH